MSSPQAEGSGKGLRCLPNAADGHHQAGPKLSSDCHGRPEDVCDGSHPRVEPPGMLAWRIEAAECPCPQRNFPEVSLEFQEKKNLI